MKFVLFRRKNVQFHKPGDGFTLIELLVVIAIIALLVAIIMPGLKKAKDYAKFVVCSTNLHQIGLAFYAYGQDYDDRTPPGDQPNGPTVLNAHVIYGLGRLVYYNYLPTPQSEKAVIFCPADRYNSVHYSLFRDNWPTLGNGWGYANFGYEFRDSMDGNHMSQYPPGVRLEEFKGVPLSRIAHHALVSDWFGGHTYYQHKLKYNILLGDGSIYVINDIPHRGGGGNMDDPTEVGFTAWVDYIVPTYFPGANIYATDYLIFDAIDFLAGSPKWKAPKVTGEVDYPLPLRYWLP